MLGPNKQISGPGPRTSGFFNPCIHLQSKFFPLDESKNLTCMYTIGEGVPGAFHTVQGYLVHFILLVSGVHVAFDTIQGVYSAFHTIGTGVPGLVHTKGERGTRFISYQERGLSGAFRTIPKGVPGAFHSIMEGVPGTFHTIKGEGDIWCILHLLQNNPCISV